MTDVSMSSAIRHDGEARAGGGYAASGAAAWLALAAAPTFALMAWLSAVGATGTGICSPAPSPLPLDGMASPDAGVDVVLHDAGHGHVSHGCHRHARAEQHEPAVVTVFFGASGS